MEEGENEGAGVRCWVASCCTRLGSVGDRGMGFDLSASLLPLLCDCAAIYMLACAVMLACACVVIDCLPLLCDCAAMLACGRASHMIWPL
jgi:hypothetical protein